MRMRKFGSLSILLGALALIIPHAAAQLSLATAVDLALRNSPRVKMAQADLDKARAALAEAHDAFIPAVTTTGGYGASTGVPLNLPIVFSISAQSLVFNFSQKDYVRAASAGVAATNFALSEARTEAAEDAVTTYVSLNNAQQRRAALTQGTTYAGRLVQIVQDRFDTGIEPHIEVTKSKRTAAQLRLQQLVVDDEIDRLAEHLARITGVSGAKTQTVPDSIPAFTPPSDTPGSLTDGDGIRAMFANATAKGFQAHGDARYRLRPQLSFSAGYSRISTIGSSYGDYYPRFANDNFSHNSFEIGIQVSVPIVDLVHQARARGSAAEARRTQFDAEVQRNTFFESRLKLQHSANEIAARVELASLDRDMAQDELEKIQIQLTSAPGSPDTPQMSPKDEQNARLQERQKYIEYLDADLQLRQTEIMLMRQNGQLGDWLHKAMITPSDVMSNPLPSAPSVTAAPLNHP
jgi:outer membrane protein TolC